MNKTNKKVSPLTSKDYEKTELAMLVEMEKIPSAVGKREWAMELGLPWEEYLRLARKYRVILDRYRSDQIFQKMIMTLEAREARKEKQ